MWLKNRINKEAGLTLIEVLITIAILGIIIVPLSSFFITSAKINNESRDKFKATLIAQEFLEDIKLSDSIIEGEFQYNVENYDVIVNVTSVSDLSGYENSSFYNTIDYDIKIQIDKNDENYISIYDRKDNLLANDYIAAKPKIYVEMLESSIIIKIFDADKVVSTTELKNYGNKGSLILDILGDMDFTVKSRNHTEKDMILYFCKSDNSNSKYSFHNLGGKVTRYEKILISNNNSDFKGLYQINVEVKKEGHTLEKITGYRLLSN